MNNEKEIADILEKINALPAGNITRRKIRGKSRMYLQWREDGRTKSKYIKAADEEAVAAAVAMRKTLEAEYKKLKNGATLFVQEKYNDGHAFRTNVKMGDELAVACENVERYRERECINGIKAYLKAEYSGKVCLIYGLRRTGKTTMVLQSIAGLPKDKSAYIKIMSTNTMAELNQDLQLLSNRGVKYVFIDEITLMEDFIDGASLLSDVYAMFGMKIVLSGTDSLGFAISINEELYDRAIMIHTTFIPFREYSMLLGIHDVDEYIRYGGTFRVGETDFDNPESGDESASFRDDESTRRYIDTAIAKNIQHSLACYKNGNHFRHLVDLYENKEFTNAVNRIIEDMNHRFLISVLNRDFKSHDLGSSAQIQRKKAALRGERSVLDEIDTAAVTDRLMAILDIKNKVDLIITITDEHIREIKEYLEILDLIAPVPVDSIGTKISAEGYLFSQPGMRYCQAQALVFSLMKDEIFRQYPAKERKLITNQILEEVRGRMLEEIVLLETIKALPPNKRAFKLQFPIGEFDMVIADQVEMTCELYEIKHTDQIYESQYKHLIDSEKLTRTEHEYGEIKKRVVLYRGGDAMVENVEYKNVVNYLEALGGVK